MNLSLIFSFVMLALALWVLGACLFRRRPPRALALLLPLIACWAAFGLARGKPLALALLALDFFALRSLVLGVAVAAPPRRGKRTLRAAFLLACGFEALLFWAVSPLCAGLGDRLVTLAVTLPLVAFFSYFALRWIVAPAWVFGYRLYEGIAVGRDGSLVLGSVLYHPLTWWGLAPKGGEGRHRVEALVGHGLWGARLLRHYQVTGSGLELSGGSQGSVQAEFVEAERREAERSETEGKAGPEGSQAEDKKAQVKGGAPVSAGRALWVPMVFALALIVEVAVLFFLLARRGVISPALAWGGGLVSAALFGASVWVPYWLVFRHSRQLAARQKKNQKSGSPNR